jgi:adenylate cyclase
VAPASEPSSGEDVREWLVAGAPGAADAVEVVARLCGDLAASGVPLARCVVFVRTLHPETLGRWFVWERSAAVVRSGELTYARQRDFFANGPIEQVIGTGEELRRRLDDGGPFESELLTRLAKDGMTDYLALPMRFLDATIHVSTFATDRPGGFDETQRARLRRIMQPLARLAEIIVLRRTATNLLDAYVGHGAGERILRGQVRRGDVEHVRCAIWFSDLRDFTTLSAERAPEATIAMLNRVFDCQVPAVHAHGGEVLKFIGDGLLAIFPIADGASAAPVCERALGAADAALVALAGLNAEWQKDGAPPLGLGIALHLGEVAFGNIGGAGRLDFTCIGAAVNLAARLEGLTGKLGKPILVTHAFAEASPRPTVALGCFALKGVAEPIAVHEPAPLATP